MFREQEYWKAQFQRKKLGKSRKNRFRVDLAGEESAFHAEPCHQELLHLCKTNAILFPLLLELEAGQ